MHAGTVNRGRRARSKPDASVTSKGTPRPGHDNFNVVAIGASAGGLEAVRRLLAALPADTGSAFILVQHLDPTHESMMVELLTRDTAMTVSQAADGMPIEHDHLYVIPPHADLAVRAGTLRLSRPPARRAPHMPFDFLLHSLAEECGARAICIVLSGTGADGSAGLKAVSERGGLVIAQDPEEAAYDGMPRSAIATGAVNLVLPAAEIPSALIGHTQHARVPQAARPEDEAAKSLAALIDLLRARTSQDFARYKKPTLLRRVRRRMAAAGVREIEDYIRLLREDDQELELLAKDLLIHVTTFFRDPAAYEALAKTVIPELVRQHAEDQRIRLWVPGCSTGEEAYSLAMLFFEQFAAAKRSRSSRSSLPTSVPTQSRVAARACIRTRSRRMSPRSGSRAFSRVRLRVTE